MPEDVGRDGPHVVGLDVAAPAQQRPRLRPEGDPYRRPRRGAVLDAPLGPVDAVRGGAPRRVDDPRDVPAYLGVGVDGPGKVLDFEQLGRGDDGRGGQLDALGEPLYDLLLLLLPRVRDEQL